MNIVFYLKLGLVVSYQRMAVRRNVSYYLKITPPKKLVNAEKCIGSSEIGGNLIIRINSNTISTMKHFKSNCTLFSIAFKPIFYPKQINKSLSKRSKITSS